MKRKKKFLLEVYILFKCQTNFLLPDFELLREDGFLFVEGLGERPLPPTAPPALIGVFAPDTFKRSMSFANLLL